MPKLKTKQSSTQEEVEASDGLCLEDALGEDTIAKDVANGFANKLRKVKRKQNLKEEAAEISSAIKQGSSEDAEKAACSTEDCKESVQSTCRRKRKRKCVADPEEQDQVVKSETTEVEDYHTFQARLRREIAAATAVNPMPVVKEETATAEVTAEPSESKKKRKRLKSLADKLADNTCTASNLETVMCKDGNGQEQHQSSKTAVKKKRESRKKYDDAGILETPKAEVALTEHQIHDIGTRVKSKGRNKEMEQGESETLVDDMGTEATGRFSSATVAPSSADSSVNKVQSEQILKTDTDEPHTDTGEGAASANVDNNMQSDAADAAAVSEPSSKRRKRKQNCKDEINADEQGATDSSGQVTGAVLDQAGAVNKDETHKVDSCTASADSISPCLKVCAANLPSSMDKEAIQKHFDDCGAINHLYLLTDWYTRSSRGVCFITFQNRKGVKKALQLDGTDCQGQLIRVNLAEDKAKGTGANDKGSGKGWSKGKCHGKSQGKGKGKQGPTAQALADTPWNSPPPSDCPGIFVRKMSFEVTEEDLIEHFKACGQGPQKVRIMRDRSTGQSKGKAFVDFAKHDEIVEAIKLAGPDRKGRWMQIEYAKPQSK